MLRNNIARLLAATLLLSLVQIACSFILPTPAPAPMDGATTPSPTLAGSANQPQVISGEFEYTNSIITDYYVEHAVALVDMHGFVTRDREWEIPVESQTLGFLDMDVENKNGTFWLQLPAQPAAASVDVDNDNQSDAGVQVFVVAYWPNLTGGPFSEGDDRSLGWPSYLTSAITDTENNDEVIGGKLVVWAPDTAQQFPTGFGADGLLFTADDPVGSVPAGYSIVDLDSDPFGVSQEREPRLTLYEPQDVALKDFSTLSYSEAFDQMFEKVSKEYAFNGIAGKEPDWEAVYAEIKPRVEQAQSASDPRAYYLAIRDFTRAFKDGHVGLSGGSVQGELFQQSIAGGYGFAMRELENGKAVVTLLVPNGPADQAGMQLGAEVTAFNDTPIKQAIGQVQPWSLPHSTNFALRFQQARYLVRAELNTQANVTFTNPGGSSQTVTLTTVNEVESFNSTSIFQGFDEVALPVEHRLLDSGVGYVKVNSNYDDLGLIIKLFERALKTFSEQDVPGIIIDMRQNTGGAPLGLAGFLTDNEIPMGQLEYFSEKTGKFEPEGLRQKVLPNENQYRFDKLVLLVGQACFSACEIESFAFSQVPGMVVVGEYPTAGVEAEVARGQFLLPEGLSLQIPTGRFTLPDGSIFLEGSGVEPDLRVPIDETTVFSSEDEVLKAGERAVLQPLGAGITPSGPPRVLDAALSEAELNKGTQFLEDRARESYSTAEMAELNRTFSYTVTLSQSEPLMWAWGWCATTQEILEENFSAIELSLAVNNQPVSLDGLLKLDYPSNGLSCRAYLAAITDWKGGENHVVNTVTFSRTINDGTAEYQAGQQVFDYGVFVRP